MIVNFTDWDHALAHHGIKGQKWGQRRFQNEDGSLTAAGRLRYEQAGHKMSRRARKAAKADEIAKNAKVHELANRKRELEKKYRVGSDDLDGWRPQTGKRDYGINQKQYDSIIKARGEYKKAKEDYKSAYGYNYNQAGKISRKASKLVKKANKKSTAKNVVKKAIAAKWAYNKTKSSDIPKGKKIIKTMLLYGIGKRVLRTKVTHQ